tara:strand:+ start:836 stop:1222 length:387 start_codon:yes stop_codon:yes gene_type:complete
MILPNNSQCYICFENNNDNSVSPCKCNHSVHIECLLDWINTKKKFDCEICKSKYRLSSDSYNNYINNYIDNFTVINFDIDTNNTDRNVYNNLINIDNNQNPVDILSNKIASLCIIFIMLIGVYSILEQ